MLDFFWVLIRPHFWIRNYRFSKEWDKFIRKCIDENRPVQSKSRYDVKIDGVTIWIENYPHAYGRPYGDCPVQDVLPARRTAKRFRDYLIGLGGIDDEKIKHFIEKQSKEK